ncbi:AP-3 complex subunit beta-1 [Zootermopsis nevadensis]|uniref:AP-3 complex subunit beta n=1 Tax=Zootermopsis nevadensis TaxID=136037 RepID=A0A067R759_ZOONE|nr:AP-3 complex subunit beta-1 [Zootermopsis nevadensis]KDR14139.1 AP-3 complex subunit beta-2 [Zootermopsis nevadensis]
MASNGSYNNDRPSSGGEPPEYSADPASGSFFHSDYKKHEDLKQMLDSNKDSLKLEAMKRIIGMVAKGRDASDLFPAVVKNVVSKNIEVKKLVYVYLVRYAEEQQDLALLSISTFQRALKDPNQLIRASALRVLSSIRVPMIVPIVMLAIKDSASDMSPYVRKTAAHAIPKLYSLDQEQKEELVHVIEKLLSDKTTLVVGSAVMAFEEVCPERIDLIHKNYRKLCNLLVDVDEWGQVIIINMLTRYARTQFTDPNADDVGEESQNKPFYDDEDDDDADEGDSEEQKKEEKTKKTYTLDHDHRLLLRNTKPLLQSRNASVVMGVAQLYHHLAPRSEVMVVAKALIRLLRSHREVQSVVLNCIASISTLRKGMFEPFLKSFFVRTSDPTHIKLLKLEILTNLATETSISVILREFQTYISSHDKEFVAAAIQAIGRCASNIKEVTDSCLNGLVSLLSNRDEAVVAESVVVIKKLLQTQPNEHKDIIIHMAKLVDFITVPQARASILWLLGEYSDRVPKIAPDVLRKMAKTFISEEDIVKLQILNLAVKLYLTNPKQTRLLCQYVFSLARYDQNYDIRDRARFLRQFIFPSAGVENSKLTKHAKKIFLATKPAPVLESKFKDREQFQLGSLSHYINARANGYHDLPAFPDAPSDSSVRDVELIVPVQETRVKKQHTVKKRSFYSESEQSSPVDEDSDEESSEEGTSEDEDSSSEEDDSSREDSESQSSDSDVRESGEEKETKANAKQKKTELKKAGKEDNNEVSEESDSGETMDDSSEEEKSDSSESSSADKKKPAAKEGPTKTVSDDSTKSVTKPKSNLDLLLELDDVPPTITPVLTPSLGGFLTPLSTHGMPITSVSIQLASPSFIPMKTTELLNKISGRGLHILSRFTRSPHLFSPAMVSIELTFTNLSSEELMDIRISQKNLPSGMSMHDFAMISVLPINATVPGTIGVDFNDSTQPVSFNITVGGHHNQVTIRAPVGELIRAVTMPEPLFITEQSKLRGMNEHNAVLNLVSSCIDQKTICQRVFEAANVASIPSTDSKSLRFAGQTLSSKSLVLVTIKILENDQANISVNCEKMVIGSMLLNEIKSYLRN